MIAGLFARLGYSRPAKWRPESGVAPTFRFMCSFGQLWGLPESGKPTGEDVDTNPWHADPRLPVRRMSWPTGFFFSHAPSADFVIGKAKCIPSSRPHSTRAACLCRPWGQPPSSTVSPRQGQFYPAFFISPAALPPASFPTNVGCRYPLLNRHGPAPPGDAVLSFR